MLKLAWPIVLAEVGWMAMSIVDTIMVGHLPDSAAAIGGVSLGSMLYYTIGIFASGLLLGLDTLVSQSFGAGDREDCHHSLIAAIYIALILSPVMMGLVMAIVPQLGPFGIHPDILREAAPYMRALNWSTLPLMLYFGLRRYLQGMSLVKPVTFTLITANLVNLAGNWVLVYGLFGAPRMGVEGSAWSTVMARIYMAAVLGGYAVWHDLRNHTGLLRARRGPDFRRMREILELGLPAGLQILVETGTFAAATALIGRLDPASLAGHQVALNAASLTFLVALGIGSAAAVRVGQSLGSGDRHAAKRAGWTALGMGFSFMCCASAIFAFAPRPIVRAYTNDPDATRVGIRLLAIAAVFQIFDGLQAVATGALRGAGDTRTPMLVNALAYWLFGLPLGYFLCFELHWGAPGLWIGLCLGLILIGSVLVAIWSRQFRAA